MWICIFTCLVVRAVHLEIVTDLTAESFIRYVKSMVRFMKSVFQEDTVLNYLSRQGVASSPGLIFRISNETDGWMHEK